MGPIAEGGARPKQPLRTADVRIFDTVRVTVPHGADQRTRHLAAEERKENGGVWLRADSPDRHPDWSQALKFCPEPPRWAGETRRDGLRISGKF